MGITYEGGDIFGGTGSTGTGDMLIENIKTANYNYTAGDPAEFTIPEPFEKIISVLWGSLGIREDEYTIAGQVLTFTDTKYENENANVQIQYYKT